MTAAGEGPHPDPHPDLDPVQGRAIGEGEAEILDHQGGGILREEATNIEGSLVCLTTELGMTKHNAVLTSKYPCLRSNSIARHDFCWINLPHDSCLVEQ